MESTGSVVCTVAGVEVKFLIDSGAEVNTVNDNIFDRLLRDPTSHPIYERAHGTDKPLRAYASSQHIPVIATFLAELFISPDRPSGIEKLYVIPGAKSLLGRSTATRYSVLQLGLGVRILSSDNARSGTVLGEVNTLGTSNHFPKFKIPAVILSYDKNSPPSRKVYTNISPAYKTEVENRLQSLLSSDIIEKVTNNMDKSFCSSLLVVPKGKRDIRLVVDLRGPNKCIIRTPFRMATLEEILSKLNGAGWFSTIDLTNAFYHIVLDESCRHLTNFFSGNDTYRFIRLPFGLCNAPDIFQEILQTVVLAQCPGTVNYLDDILVFGHTKEEHDENLRYTLSRLREHNVLLNSDKCVFGKQTVKFLGFLLSHDGWRVDEDKRKAIEGFRRPETLTEVKSFLGLINFLEKFTLSRAERTKNLRVLANSLSFYWTELEEFEFNDIKNAALN